MAMQQPVGPQPPNAEVRFISPVKLAIVSARGPYARSVGQAWNQMFAWLDSRQHSEPVTIGYGLAHDDPQTTLSTKIRYDAGIPLPASWKPEDENFAQVHTFRGGSYTVQHYAGPYQNLGRLISQTRRDFIARSGLVLDRTRPVVCIYRSDPRQVGPEDQHADVCLPVMIERRATPRT